MFSFLFIFVAWPCCKLLWVCLVHEKRYINKDSLTTYLLFNVSVWDSNGRKVYQTEGLHPCTTENALGLGFTFAVMGSYITSPHILSHILPYLMCMYGIQMGVKSTRRKAQVLEADLFPVRRWRRDWRSKGSGHMLVQSLRLWTIATAPPLAQPVQFFFPVNIESASTVVESFIKKDTAVFSV